MAALTAPFTIITNFNFSVKLVYTVIAGPQIVNIAIINNSANVFIANPISTTTVLDISKNNSRPWR